MPRKEPEKITSLVPTKSSTLPQTERQRKRRAGQRIPGATRRLFLQAYEDNFGNVSTACKLAGIHRRTFYRWLESRTRVNLKFQQQLSLLRADERFVDAAEHTIAEGLAKGDMTAAIFTLKTKGRHRGWSERPETVVIASELLDKVANAFQMFLADNPNVTFEEKIEFMGKFARGGNVPPAELARKVGIEII